MQNYGATNFVPFFGPPCSNSDINVFKIVAVVVVVVVVIVLALVFVVVLCLYCRQVKTLED